MNAYTAKNFSVAMDFQMAARMLAAQGTEARMEGMTLHTTASLETVQGTVKGLAQMGAY